MKTISKISKKYIFINLVLILVGFSSNAQTQAQEYDLKAACIYNITKFIYWEPTSNGDEFIIGIIGSSPIYEPLVELVKTKTVNNKRIVVKQFTKAEEINNCDMLFIPKNTTISLDEILDRAMSKKILTISEKEGYAQQGTTINFINDNDRLKFEVNIKTLDSLGLKASSQFLKLTIIIN